MDREWQRPKLVVSSCLNKEKCRYDGSHSPCKALEDLREYIDVVPVCPEMGIGLKVPRDSIRIVGSIDEYKLIDPRCDEDLTEKMVEFSKKTIDDLLNDEIDGFILKGRSPSCGIQDVKIYNTKEKGSMSVKGRGLFAKYVVDNFPFVSVEEDGRLRSFEIRDNFFIKIFTFADFNKVKKLNDLGYLVDFHTRNKLLFMTYSPDLTKQLGIITANKEGKSTSDIIKEYHEILGKMMKKSQNFRRCNHVFEKAYGYISDFLYEDEKLFFRETLAEFKSGKQAKKTVITLLKSYAIRFDNQYLLSQTLLEPYPEKLLNLDDSGKGIAR